MCKKLKRRLTVGKKRGIMQEDKDKRCFYLYKNNGGIEY